MKLSIVSRQGRHVGKFHKIHGRVWGKLRAVDLGINWLVGFDPDAPVHGVDEAGCQSSSLLFSISLDSPDGLDPGRWMHSIPAVVAGLLHRCGLLPPNTAEARLKQCCTQLLVISDTFYNNGHDSI